MIKELFKIEKIGHITKFTNISEYKVWITVNPEKPKRKSKDFCVIDCGQFVIFENDIDFSQISISFSCKFALQG